MLILEPKVVGTELRMAAKRSFLEIRHAARLPLKVEHLMSLFGNWPLRRPMVLIASLLCFSSALAGEPGPTGVPDIPPPAAPVYREPLPSTEGMPEFGRAAAGGVSSTATPRGPVLGVKIIGNRSVSELEIRRHIKTHKDRAYDPQLVQEDLRRLFATRKFHNVRVDKKVTPQGVFVTFEVLERPTIQEVLFIGNKYASDKKLLKESGLSKDDALNVYAVQEARRKVEEYYHGKGYAKVKVTVIEGDKAGDQRVVLRVDEGHIERIWTVNFVGNDPHLVTDSRLKTLIKSKPGFLKYLFRGTADYSVIDEDTERLTAYYRNLGYFRARVSREIDYDDSGQWLTLTFVIDEGPRYEIRNLEIVGAKKFDPVQLKQRFKLQAGDFFNMEKMKRDENMLRDLYGGHGHIFADIKASPRFLEEPGLLDLVYEVKEGELFRVGEINIHVAGEFPHTRKSVVLNRLSLRPGDIIDIREVRASERRLKASQLFVTNPQEGTPPRIVIRPPSLDEAASIAKKRGGNYRGQSPDHQATRTPAHDMVLDIYLPPVQHDQH